MQNSEAILEARRALNRTIPKFEMNDEDAAEGGCGVIGLASEIPVAGRHLFKSLEQMRNRGNGKGGGVALVGMEADQFGVSEEVLTNDYMIAIAYLDNAVRADVEEQFIHSTFEVDHIHEMPTLDNWAEELPSLDDRPPDVVCYFARPKPAAIEKFKEESGLSEEDFNDRKGMLDELVFRNTHLLNVEFYATDQRADAFVLSHGQNLLILKIVGYAEDVIRYYRLDDVTAHVWIGHHRYPTRGRVTHPGGAHPFGQGIDAALVHNGDFSNYVSVKDYLGQRGMEPLFFTDTEVAALGFDLHHRVYGYPMEYVIESLAPTCELDFVMLPEEKQEVYEAIQKTHIHGSPDGPWFFIIAQADGDVHRLVGITDTSMLRPQVFAYQRGEVGIAFCGSEKQVIDAVLESLAAEDKRFWRRCDEYWNARGGSYTDGGSFLFDVVPTDDGGRELIMTNKFGALVNTHPTGNFEVEDAAMMSGFEWPEGWTPATVYGSITALMPELDWASAQALLSEITSHAQENSRKDAVELLGLLLDRKYDCGSLRRSRWLDLVEDAIYHTLQHAGNKPCDDFTGQLTLGHRPEPASSEQTIVVDARPYPIEGIESLARELVALHKNGWNKFAILHCHGHRFIGNGFGPETDDVRIDVYGSVGDYLGSGSDGMTIVMHGNGQDQIAQIHKRGTLVVHGDVGQCYGYGAKGGELFVQGNAAGRPMINSVGSPKLVINGTALDYLAESFMAGDPLKGGGFVVINGIRLDAKGEVEDLETPYPGGNLFSLSSGGAIYVRDPHQILSDSQLNGGGFTELGEADWAVVEPLLIKNEEHFGISLARLLTVEGEIRAPAEVYRKIIPLMNKALSVEDGWAAKHD
jgi:glutamate synthase domain-containing protein 1/glutamate synthase domain-containing protein 3